KNQLIKQKKKMSQLHWELVKNFNCYQLKNFGQKFTKDPYSLTGKNTFYGSGFLHLSGLALNKGEKSTVVASLRKNQTHKKVRKSGNLEGAQLNVKSGFQRVAKVIRKTFQTKGVRQAALRKLVNFHRASVRAQVNAKAQKK
ncbi:hypothetical protein IMG5_103610, partial [Ichthyophthirius multifiliis]